ncbi:uncharacterized protein [Rutidosis leptorrhynchoides]|uniref:uncharacterized protein n=1 Tax=Rutidosis leptorrhynchoides TaxID=125765 RepID=UPI003A9A5FF1
MYIDDDNSPIPADQASVIQKIQPVFPLFDQNLLSTEIKNQLSPVDKVFVESSHRAPSSSASKYDEIEGKLTNHCVVSPIPFDSTLHTMISHPLDLEIHPRSSFAHRVAVFYRPCPRIGPDFLPSRKTMMLPKPVVKGNNVGGGKTKGVKKGKMVQNGNNVSAHGVYLKNKEQTQDERARSYLPYRPEIMGLFSNVNGGSSKNVHP